MISFEELTFLTWVDTSIRRYVTVIFGFSAAVDCPRPWDDDQLITTGTFHFNSTAAFACADGHRLVGSSRIFCKLNGEWAQPLPSCVPVHCPPLNASDPRLYVDANGTAYDDVALFSCSTGYKILGAGPSSMFDMGDLLRSMHPDSCINQ